MKPENNWRNKTLENLEKYVWNDSTSSNLITRCVSLRKVVLNNFSIEDLRIMISQQIGLSYLVPLAIENLTHDLFAEGDLYPGDLLKSVLNIEPNFWIANKKLWLQVDDLIHNKKSKFKDGNFSTERFMSSIQ